MTLATTWPAVAATLRDARRAIARALGPSGPDRRVPVPFCVSYGRAVFCLHLHEPRPSHRRRSTRRSPADGLRTAIAISLWRRRESTQIL
jgi:hypothetical protein